jgi:MFS family permease
VVWTTLKIPPHPERATRVDYLGAALLGLGLSLALLATVRGGQEAPWGSAEILGLFGAAAVVLAVFGAHERRIEHPIVPLGLFRLRVFSASSAAGFTVGMAMFGAIMFVPLFVQGVQGGSATNAGLVLTPLMLALVATSVVSGQLISRTGRYRWALISGPVVMFAGFALLAGLGTGSSRADATIAMTVLGLGLGLLMQNLVLAVQNAVPARDLGAGTSAAQFFRSIGGTIGVSIMGAILSAGLPAGAAAGASLTASAAPAAREVLSDALHPIFLVGMPLMALTLLLTLLIPEVPLRRSVREDTAPAPLEHAAV